MVTINPKAISGEWRAGVALDQHTISSVYLGPDENGHEQYETTRSEIGELLYRLKYKADASAADAIVAAAVEYLTPRRHQVDVLVPVPPSSTRALPPVLTLANGIGTALNLPVVNCITTTRPTSQLKNVTNTELRKEALAGLYAVPPGIFSQKKVLLFDDLFRSGATMNEITKILKHDAHASDVFACTITYTRSNQ